MSPEDDPPDEVHIEIEPNIYDHRPTVYHCRVWITADGPFMRDTGLVLVWNWIIT